MGLTLNSVQESMKNLPASLQQGAKNGFIIVKDGANQAAKKVTEWTGVAKDWTTRSAIAAKDWAVAHQKEILTAIAVLGVATMALGLALIAQGLTSGALITSNTTWNWMWDGFIETSTLALNPSLGKGLVLLPAGFFAAAATGAFSPQAAKVQN